jgi:hypothetical protein
MSREPTAPGPPQAFDYDAAVRVLQRSLTAATANARAFGARTYTGHGLISARGWNELAEIEAHMVRLLRAALQRELRTEPRPLAARVRSWLRGERDSWSGERSLIARQLREASSWPVAAWRAGNPQLEAVLWPFFQSRTQHLANQMALALHEPAPYPAIVWHPGRREFRN